MTSLEGTPTPNPNVPQKMSIIKRPWFKKILRFLFSHVGLIFLNIGHLSVGAVIFIALEGDQDNRRNQDQLIQLDASQRIDSARRELIDRLIWNSKLDNMTEEVMKQRLDEYQMMIGNEISENNYKAKITTEDDLTPSNRWSFTSALLFTLSIASSIGYGHIFPKTEPGYLALILYGLMAIPFFVMSLGSIGSGMAVILKASYKRACCWSITRRRQRNQPPPSPSQNQHPEENERQEPTTPDNSQQSDEKEQCEEANDAVPVTLAMGMVFTYIVLGALIFLYKEEWTYIQSVYFCIVTFMTIGFGDFFPGYSTSNNVEGQVSIAVAFLYIVIGLALVSMLLNVAVDALRHRITLMISKVKIFEDEEVEEDKN